MRIFALATMLLLSGWALADQPDTQTQLKGYFFDAARRAEPDLLPGLARGDFSPLLSWLRTHVHGLGSLLSPAELIERATGAPLSTRVFEAHLRQRYLAEA